MTARPHLNPEELKIRLRRGTPILGSVGTDDGQLSCWMSKVEDDRPLQSLNIAGTHDSCSWNPRGLVRGVLQNQNNPIFTQLRDGVRAFDIRFGMRDGVLRLFHGDLLLDSTVELEDVFWGFYQFLETHSSEMLLISLKVDNGPTDVAVKDTLYRLLTSSPARDFWHLGTELPLSLAACRGRLVLLRRFAWDRIPIGIDLTNWPGMPLSGKFKVDYSPTEAAWVEDLYQFDLGNVPARAVTDAKWAALRDHLERAQGDEDAKAIYLGFASGAGQINSHYVTPRLMATGSHTGHPLSDTKGVNPTMLEWLGEKRDKSRRVGIVLFDFYDQPPALLSAVISLQPDVPARQ